MRTLKLTTASWTAAIPARWEDFEVQFSNDEATGFTNYAGQKFMALHGSQIRGSGVEVEALFDGLVRSGMAAVVAAPEKLIKPTDKIKEASSTEKSTGVTNG